MKPATRLSTRKPQHGYLGAAVAHSCPATGFANVSTQGNLDRPMEAAGS